MSWERVRALLMSLLMLLIYRPWLIKLFFAFRNSLAWCELWVLFANLFRRFHVELAPYTPKNMEWVDVILVQ